MHNYNASGGTSFSYNSDFSGPVIITVGDDRISVPVPADDLLEFVAEEYIRNQRIAALEQLPASDLLLGK